MKKTERYEYAKDKEIIFTPDGQILDEHGRQMTATDAENKLTFAKKRMAIERYYKAKLEAW